MNKMIASGVLVDSAEMTIVASIYVDLNADGTESTEAGAHSAVVSYKKYNADAMPAAPITYEDIAGEVSGSGSLNVPGVAGHEDVALAAPTAIKYSKTKAFVTGEESEESGAEGRKAQIYAALRYNF